MKKYFIKQEIMCGKIHQTATIRLNELNNS